MIEIEPPPLQMSCEMHMIDSDNRIQPIYADHQGKDDHHKEESLPPSKVIEGVNSHEIKRVSRPLWISTLIVKYPIIMLLVTVIIYISFSVIVFTTDAAKIDNSYYRDYLVWGDTIVNHYDSMELSAEDLNENYPNGEQPLRTTRMDPFATQILFECNDCTTILTVENVKQMYEVEQIMVNDPNYGNF